MVNYFGSKRSLDQLRDVVQSLRSLVHVSLRQVDSLLYTLTRPSCARGTCYSVTEQTMVLPTHVRERLSSKDPLTRVYGPLIIDRPFIKEELSPICVLTKQNKPGSRKFKLEESECPCHEWMVSGSP